MSTNGVMMQSFHWYTNFDGTFWRELAAKAPELARDGFTAIWLPPACKGQGGKIDVGYGVYDLFDLGEFFQKASRRTKYGTKEELLLAIKALQAQNIQVYADVVFKHKNGADEIEKVRVQEVDWQDRSIAKSPWYEILAYTGFIFTGRGNIYSSMKWHWWHFDTISFNAETKDRTKLFRLKNKHFPPGIPNEYGKFEYRMACELDTDVPEVRGELMYWGRWLVDTTSIDGFRIDSAKYINEAFFRDWINHLRTHFSNRELFTVGEYWSENLAELKSYIEQTNGVMSLFDVPLHYKLYQAGRLGIHFDLRTIFDNTLVKDFPTLAVTFVDNHDTQPCQSLESTVEAWFKPLAYALILLRSSGYPCVFYPDYYGAQYENGEVDKPPIVLYSHRYLIDKFLWARKNYNYGEQIDYFNDPTVIGWVRLGDPNHPKAMAVVVNTGFNSSKWMDVKRSNVSFSDITGHIKEKVVSDARGWANFPCLGGSVSVWIQQ